MIVASQSQLDSERDLVPLSEVVRSGIFGGGAVVLSIMGFIVGRKEPNNTIPMLLFVNGRLIILG